MFLVFGQFWNQTLLRWDWQQIGGTICDEDDALQYAEGFAKSYDVPSKVIARKGVFLFLPPPKPFLGDHAEWPTPEEGSTVQIAH